VADPMEIARTFGIPLLGAVGGWITSTLKATSRVTALEKGAVDQKKAYDNDKIIEEKRIEKYERSIKEQFENLIKSWKLELQSQKEDGQKDVNELKKQLKEVEDSFTRFTRNSHHDFANNEEFARYVEETNRQWKVVERTLGQIEGWMKAQPKGPSTFPPPAPPRPTMKKMT
jgi:chromosome segregation ATPase